MNYTFTQTLKIVEDHPCYKDHFPGHPIVPGALLLKWISDAITSYHSEEMGQIIKVNEVKSIKYHNSVLPGCVCLLTCNRNNDILKIELSNQNTTNQKKGLLCGGVLKINTIS